MCLPRPSGHATLISRFTYTMFWQDTMACSHSPVHCILRGHLIDYDNAILCNVKYVSQCKHFNLKKDMKLKVILKKVYKLSGVMNAPNFKKVTSMLHLLQNKSQLKTLL